jgi:hypothetical protein
MRQDEREGVWKHANEIFRELKRDVIEQETMKPGEKLHIMVMWLLNHSLHFSGFHGFLLTHGLSVGDQPR